MNLNSILNNFVKNNPLQKSIIVSKNDIILTYMQLYEKIQIYSYFFIKNNIQKGENVAIKLRDSEFWVIIFYSLLNIGANPVLLDNSFTNREIIECLEISKTNMIITEKINHNSLIEKCKKVFLLYDLETNKIYDEKIILIDDKILNDIHDKKITYSGFSNIILFTYRGFGYPLAVLYSEKSLIESIYINDNTGDLNSETITASLLPLSHIFAFTSSVLSILAVGGTTVIINNRMPGEILKSIEKYNVNLIIAVPTLIKILIETQKKKGFYLTKCKKGMIGGNSFSKELYQEWFELTKGSILIEGYGLTETCPALCNPWINYKLNSLGKPMNDVFTKIVDENRKELPIGKNGILLIKKKGMMTKYLNISKDTENIYVDEWFDTGDIVRSDKDNFYYFEKRNKDIVKIGGVTVDINEVKKIVLSHKSVTEAKFIIENDPIWQEKIICNIKTDIDLQKDDFVDFLRNNLSLIKIPKEININ